MTGQGEKILENVFLVGGSEISHAADCSVYLIAGGDELTLIDSGAGLGVSNIVANVKACGFSPERLFLIISTHAHVDHIGGNAYFQREYGCEICAHELDASRIESGQMIGSEFYGVDYKPCRVTRKMTGPEMSLHAGDVDLHALHIPGHTPGSIAVYTDIEGTRVLFGQDVHGPYIPQWGAWMEQVGPSLKKMKELNADILCEGHFGVFSPNGEVTRYIDQFLTRFG